MPVLWRETAFLQTTLTFLLPYRIEPRTMCNTTATRRPLPAFTNYQQLTKRPSSHITHPNMPTAHQVTESANKADSNNNENNNNEPSPPPRGSSVHLEGFADAIPSPMAVAPKASTNTASTQQPSSQSPSQKTSPSQKVAAAREASNSLIQNALLSSLESSYITLQSERDSLQSQLTEALNVVSSLKLENASLKSSHDTNLKSIEDQGRKWRGELSAERERREEMEKKLRWCEERCVRLEGEGDSLRGEIRWVDI